MIDLSDFAWKELLSAFIGTFVGAYVAFKLEDRRRVVELINQRGTEGNLALLTLYQMYNVMRQFQKEVIELAPNRHGRWLTMVATVPQSDTRLAFVTPKLAFLLEYEDKNLLPEVLQEQSRFQLAIDLISRRAHMMLEKVNPAISAAGVELGQNLPEAAFKKILGPALSTEAEQLTEGIVRNVNENVQSLKATFDKLRLALVTLLPGQKFIRVEFDMPKGPSNSAKR